MGKYTNLVSKPPPTTVFMLSRFKWESTGNLYIINILKDTLDWIRKIKVVPCHFCEPNVIFVTF